MLSGPGSRQSSAPSQGIFQGGKRLRPAWVLKVLLGGLQRARSSGAVCSLCHISGFDCPDGSNSTVQRGPEGLGMC